MIVTDKKYFMEKWLTEELDHLKKCVDKKWDAVILVDGVEGSAKTTFSGGIAYYLDNKFGLENVVFSPQQFVEAVDNAKKGTAILWDEFSLAGLSTDAMTKVQSTILKKMTTIRSKGLFIILVISWVFELRKYFAVGRTRFLLHTTTPDGISRGFFKYWGFDKKRQLYFKGRKLYEYVVGYDMRGRFTNTEGLFYSSKEYDEKKEAAVKSIDFEGKKDTKWKDQRDKGIVYCRKELKRPCKEIGKAFDMSHNNISVIVNSVKDINSLEGKG